MSQEEVKEEGFEEIVYIKNVKVTAKKGKKNDKAVNENDEENDKEKYLKPSREPNNVEKRKLLAKSIEIMIIITLENHVYKFGNEIRKQKYGGPIGLSLTGEIAECYMINWDKLFLTKLKSLGIEPAIYERFKDDITIVVESLEAGSLYKNNLIELDQQKTINDQEKTEEEITMNIIKDIADSMDEMIKFEIDYPGNHKSGKIPILDIQASMNKEKENKIEFEFYEKPTKNKFVILSDSAIPSKQKRIILTQD